MQIKQALASSDEEEEGGPTLAASVKRWWTGGKALERQATTISESGAACVIPWRLIWPASMGAQQL